MLDNFADEVLRETQKMTEISSVSGAVFFNPPLTIEYPYSLDYEKYIKKVEERVMALDQRYRDTFGDML
jgi:hypothetical protein